MKFNNNEASFFINNLIEVIQINKNYLSEIDGKIGDGDHGINMNKGFSLCKEKLDGKEYSMSQGFKILSETLMDDIGGSMGPLYGLFFEELANTSEDKEYIDEEVFKEMLRNAIEAIESIGNAKRGDKTLLDTLIPAMEGYEKELDNGKSFYDAIVRMRIEAEKGWQSTKEMIAKIGRASRLGERSKGVLDAGATSCYLILNSLGASIQTLLLEE